MLKKALIGITSLGLVTGGIVAASFSGGTTIENAKGFIDTISISLNSFKNNETALVSKISELKTLKLSLTEQVNDLKVLNINMAKEKEQLLSQITTLELTITDLEKQLEDNDNNEITLENERLTSELTKANTEINRANELVASLQAKLDTLNVPTPISDEELNNIINDATIEQPNGQYPPLTEGEISSANKVFNREGYYAWNGSTALVDRLADDSVKINISLADKSTRMFLFYENGEVEEFVGDCSVVRENKVRAIQINDKESDMTIIMINNN